VKIAIIPTFLVLLGAGGSSQLSTAPTPLRLASSTEEASQRQTGVETSRDAGTPCLFDFERGEVPNCIMKSTTGDLFIAPQYLKDLEFDSHGLAAVRSPIDGWMYVNRKGKVVIRGVAVMDNGADTFHDGLVRIVRDKKYGFANRSGQIVIPPVYDGATNFQNGNARVCKGCQDKCAEPTCEHHVFSGGDWFLINVKGAILRKIRLT
jgi:hypothetical protein